MSETVTNLRTAAVWGSAVLRVESLAPGRSFVVGDAPGAVIARPDSVSMPDAPVRAVGNGWELDARGVTGGVVFLRGRREDALQLAQSGAPVPIVAGDYGLLQYGTFSVFFQFATVPAPKRRRWWAALLFPIFILDLSMALALLFSASLVGGLLMIFRSQGSPDPFDPPAVLMSQRELEELYRVKQDEPEVKPESSKSDDGGGTGVKDPGAKDKKDQGGGKKMAKEEGKLGKDGQAEETKLTGDPRNGLGGMTEALNSEVGEEVRRTLGTISSVADALGGLRSDSIVLGAGSGTGLRGGGPGGGGNGPGVPFGSGTLDTGWGPGMGGGYGSGSGGPGGPGTGGNGRGGSGTGTGSGNGDGSGERKVTGKDAPKPGQGLSPNQISRVVGSRYGAFRACYEAAASSNPSLAGGVTISFSVTPGGSVGSASVASSSLGNGRVDGCIQRIFQRLQFPSADKATNASWPFVFKPSKK